MDNGDKPNFPFAVPDLSQLGENPLAGMPDMGAIEFRAIDYSVEVEQQQNMVIRIVFWFPMLPFIKFSIPWALEHAKALHLKLTKAIEVVERVNRGESIEEIRATADIPPESAA